MKIVPDVAKCISRPRLSLADASANEHSRSVQLYVNIVNFFKADASSLKTCSTWTVNSAYDWWLQNCKLGNAWAWVYKIAMIGYTWLFVYESLRSYQGRMNVRHGPVPMAGWWRHYMPWLRHKPLASKAKYLNILKNNYNI